MNEKTFLPLNAYYIENGQLKIDGDLLKFSHYSDNETNVFPIKNISFVIIGKNTSISSKAMELLTDNNIMVGFVTKDITRFFCANQKVLSSKEYLDFFNKYSKEDYLSRQKNFIEFFRKFFKESWESSLIGDYFYTDDKIIKQSLNNLKNSDDENALEVFGESVFKYCFNELFKNETDLNDVLLWGKNVSDCLAHVICWQYPYSCLVSFNKETLAEDLSDFIYPSVVLPLVYIGAEQNWTKQKTLNLILEVFVQTDCFAKVLDFLKRI